MTVKNIAISVARLLQADDIEEMLSSYAPADADADDAENADVLNDEDVKLLVTCVNTAAANIAADGFPITLKERFASSDGRIALSSFTRPPSTVRRVEDGTGTVPFELDSSYISVPRDGEYDITYTVEPVEAKLDDDIELGALCDRSMLTYLAARNYCLVTGRTDEASVWDQMYDVHTSRKRLSRRARLPHRIWG